MSAEDPLAFVCPRWADGSALGGAETLMRQLAEHLAGRGKKVDFLTTCAEDHFTWDNVRPAGERRCGNLTVRFFPVDRQRDHEAFVRLQQRIGAGCQLTADEQQQWLREGISSEPLLDWLLRHGRDYERIITGPYLFALTCRAAAIFPGRTLLLPCLHDEPFARLQPVREMFGSVRGFLFNTEPEQELARKLYELPAERCAVAGMGLNEFTADPGAFAARRKLPRPYLLYCGRREPLKGTPLLLDYFAAFVERTGREVDMVLTGRGEVSPPEGLRGRVHDAGLVDEREKREAMAGALVFCHPSRNESFGIVLLESWLAGTPGLVHSGSAVLRYQCRRGGGGLWFRHYPEFEETLLRLLDDSALRDALADSGRRYVLRAYGWEAVEQRLLNALERI